MARQRDSKKPTGAYHHGNLRAALITAALDVLADRGVDGFSLRETARRAGVSPAAPKHHFADTRALLTAVAAAALAQLADMLEAADATGSDRASSLQAQARAYVGFALDHPGLFDLIWRAPLLNLADDELVTAKMRAFATADRRVRGADAVSPPFPIADQALTGTFACWAMGHGFARMLIDGTFGPDPALRRAAAEQFLPGMIALLTASLPEEALP